MTDPELSPFVLSGVATYYLVRYLVHDRRAAAIAAVCFAYCPYVFARLPHVHLLMTAGLPLSMLAFHRMADRPGIRRGALLGAFFLRPDPHPGRRGAGGRGRDFRGFPARRSRPWVNGS